MSVNQDLVDEQAYAWTEMHKKSALSFLILAGLSEKAMWSKEVEHYITTTSQWNISERALYRVLNRMERQGSIAFSKESAERTGADRKVYSITEDGSALLASLKDELGYLKQIV